MILPTLFKISPAREDTIYEEQVGDSNVFNMHKAAFQKLIFQARFEHRLDYQASQAVRTSGSSHAESQRIIGVDTTK